MLSGREERPDRTTTSENDVLTTRTDCAGSRHFGTRERMDQGVLGGTAVTADPGGGAGRAVPRLTGVDRPGVPD